VVKDDPGCMGLAAFASNPNEGDCDFVDDSGRKLWLDAEFHVVCHACQGPGNLTLSLSNHFDVESGT
jgi:hypothetical protein